MSLKGHTMSEEFKAIRITLSEEAFERLGKIMNTAAFRSNSSAIEECIRVVHNIIEDIWIVLGAKGAPPGSFTDQQAAYAFRTIAARMGRFTDRAVQWVPEE